MSWTINSHASAPRRLTRWGTVDLPSTPVRQLIRVGDNHGLVLVEADPLRKCSDRVELVDGRTVRVATLLGLVADARGLEAWLVLR